MTAVHAYPSHLVAVAAVIPAEGTLSGAVDLSGTSLVAVVLPAAFTGTALSFQAAISEAGTYLPIHTADGTALSAAVTQNRYVVLDPALFAGVRYLKVQSSSTEPATRTLTLMTRPV